MSITIELNLPEGLILQARQMGLLDNDRVGELLAEEVRRRNAGQELKKTLDQIRSAPGLSLSRNDAVAIEATVGKDLWAYDKAHQIDRRIGSPNSDPIH